jgi:hypothetical protein
LKLVAQIIFTVYAAAVGVIGQYAAFDSADLHYPGILAVLTSLSALSLCIAVLIITLRWHPQALIKYWPAIFWISCIDLAVGLAMDATIPQDFNMEDAVWLLVAIFVVAFLAPAYYCSYLVAYRSGSSR